MAFHLLIFSRISFLGWPQPLGCFAAEDCSSHRRERPPDTGLIAAVARFLNSQRWSDVVIHAGVARWVEVAENMAGDSRSQIRQVLQQIDATLAQIGSNRQRLLEVLIFLAELSDAPILNELWDAWVPEKHPPIRACVQAGLGAGLRVEMLVIAAINQQPA